MATKAPTRLARFPCRVSTRNCVKSGWSLGWIPIAHGEPGNQQVMAAIGGLQFLGQHTLTYFDCMICIDLLHCQFKIAKTNPRRLTQLQTKTNMLWTKSMVNHKILTVTKRQCVTNLHGGQAGVGYLKHSSPVPPIFWKEFYTTIYQTIQTTALVRGMSEA